MALWSKKRFQPLSIALQCLFLLTILLLHLVVLLPVPSEAARDLKDNVPSGREGEADGNHPDFASKRVLILHSFAYAQPVYKIIDQTLVESFVARGLNFNNLHFEFLDMARNPGQEHRSRMTAFYRDKYRGRKIDLVITLHLEALQFLLAEGRDIYPEGPIISILGDSSFADHSDLKRPLIYLPFTVDVVSTVKEIFNLKPSTRKILVISGSSNLDRRFDRLVQDALKEWDGAPDVESLQPLPMDEILEKVARLPPETAILYTTVFADSAGRMFIPADAARMISRSANAPVFGLFETLIGDKGVVGGVMLQHRIEGERAVRSALEVLGGKLPSKSLTILPAPLSPLFDWEQLNRWGLDETRLTPGSIVLNRPKTLWTEYRGLVIGGIAVFLAQTLLVIGLLVQGKLKRRAELLVRQKTEELDQFFNVSPDFLCIANTEGYFLRLNPAAERILGYTHEELMARPFLDFVHPDDLDGTREVLAALESQQRILSFENRYRCKDGTYRWLQWSSAPAGKLAYAAARDVTEGKRVGQALAESQAQLLALFNSTNDMIWSVDPENFGLVTFNGGLRDYFLKGRGIEIKAGMTPDDLLKPEYALRWREFYALALREGSYVTEYVASAGTNSLLLSINPMMSKGMIFGISVFGKDVTEIMEKEKELRNYRDHLEEMIRQRTAELVVSRDQAEAANRAKSVFLANMSHELRTPLASILGICELLEKDPDCTQRHGMLLGILERSGKHLFDLIDDVLELSKIDAGRDAVIDAPLDLRSFLEELSGALGSRAEKKNLEMVVELDGSLPGYIRTDAHKLRQILLNLIGNGIKFTDKGRVVLRAMRRETAGGTPVAEGPPRVQLAFEVEDTGIGIPPEDLGRIFEMFFQAHPGRNSSGGVGLGLAISRKLTELLGGELTVLSEVGRGSLFRLNIGAERLEETDMPRQEIARKVTGLAAGQPSYRLLVVDDNLESRLLLRRLLEPVGFEVLEAADGEEAVLLCRDDPPHLIWMDIRMREMDGHEAARRIREAEQVHIPIIAFTAGVMESEQSSPLGGVFDDWVYKPFREEVIFAMLEKHLGVEFVFRPADSRPARQEARRDPTALTPAEVAELPPDWIEQFSHILKKGQSKQLLALIGQIHPAHENLARLLGDLVQSHEFERLIPLFADALKEKENG